MLKTGTETEVRIAIYATQQWAAASWEFPTWRKAGYKQDEPRSTYLRQSAARANEEIVEDLGMVEALGSPPASAGQALSERGKWGLFLAAGLGGRWVRGRGTRTHRGSGPPQLPGGLITSLLGTASTGRQPPCPTAETHEHYSNKRSINEPLYPAGVISHQQ